MKVVYIDELFLLNSLVNYLILLGSAHFTGLPFKHRRLCIAAAAGGLYAVAAYFPQLSLLCWLPLKIGVGLLLVLLAYGWSNRADFIKRTLIFYLVSLLFGGAVLAVYIISNGDLLALRNGTVYTAVSARLLIVATALACLLVSAIFSGSGKAARGGTARIIVRHRGKTAVFSALRDSGNLLRDPLGGAPVIIAELEAVRVALSSGSRSMFTECANPTSLVERLAQLEPESHWRLVPYRAVGVEGGMLAAFRPDSVDVAGKPLKGAIIAITPTPLGAGAGFCALVGEA